MPSFTIRHLLLSTITAAAFCASPISPAGAQTTAPAPQPPEAQAPSGQPPASQPSVKTTPSHNAAQEAVARPQIVTKEGVSDFKLANGLEVVVIPDHRAPVVTQMLWYHVGSADELPGKSGIAHFLEHLMFKGTKTHPAGEFSNKISEIGGQENAFTSYDYTAYYQQVSPQALEMVMTYEADRMENLVLTEDVVNTERDVILEERRMRVDGDPGAILAEEANTALFLNSPYRVPVIGWMQEMQKLSLKDATDFYQRFYTPNNATLVISGDVDPQTVLALAEKTYGKVPRRADPGPRIRPQEPEQRTRRTATLNDARVSQPSFRKMWVVPSYQNAKPGDAEALDILSEILGGSIRSRLYQELVVKQGIASVAGADYSGDALDDGIFSVYGAPRGDATLDQVETAVKAEIARVIKDGVTETELLQARNRFLKSVIFSHDNQMGMARIYGSTLAVGGTVQEVQDWPEHIRAVTKEQVKDVATRYLVEARSVTSYLLPPAVEPESAQSNEPNEQQGGQQIVPQPGTSKGGTEGVVK
ncbi:M16 family metallopeptidase [Phyllobacterium salinisoli]|uniref:M16 family metallopeptidase n=1 Tax=Phyllobacterium salinisoli TaxID=1899321 RepID=UPI001FE14983|nr:pitrilysin family protein [Phyllobacterium salinisoli]